MEKVLAEVITIGDELLFGQTLDTNTQWIGTQLSNVGISIIRRTTVGDLREEILKSLREASQRADIILITGGLGPTKDDITKQTLAAYFDTPLVVNEQALQEVTALFASRNRSITPTNAKQAELPQSCTMISNSMGTAPGMWFEQEGKVYVSMPGVPYEMKTMMEKSVVPMLKQTFKLPVIYHKMIQTAGIGESWLSDKIEQWETSLPAHIKLAYLPHYGRVRLRLTAFGENYQTLEKQVGEEVEKLLPLIQPYVYGFGDLSLEEAIGQLLSKNHQTLATAESCTGGHVAHTITSIAGSSAYFKGGMIPYSNELKISILGVKKATIDAHGAVSEQTVTEMAQQIRTLYQTDYGIATTGVAGPDGGAPQKPVGTVWIAVADAQHTYTKKLSLTQDRGLNIQHTTINILNLLRLALTGMVDIKS